jgi:endo-1,4-beta-xylanase
MVANAGEIGMSRRALLGGLAAAAFIAKPSMATTRRKLGAASMIQDVESDPQYRPAIFANCDIVVPMNDLKFDSLRYERGVFNYAPANEQINAAKAAGKDVRGHTLVWYEGLPQWVRDITDKKELRDVYINHIETVVDHYKGIIPSWDVVNEVIAHEPKRDNPWRESVWLRAMGPNYIDEAFRLAGSIDPKCELTLNDYDLEYKGKRFDDRRNEILKLVRRFRKRNIPIHAIGFQAHLYAEREVDPDAVATFVRDLRALDMKVLVTELDVIDWRLPSDTTERDRLAAEHVKVVLDAINAEGTLDRVITWGITDRHSWIHETFKRDDGLRARPLPLDENYQPKPMFDVLQTFRAAT